MDGGHLRLDLAVRDGVIAGADLASTRPFAARVLVGKTPAQALALVPLLFSLCGKAQRAVAAAALAAAGGVPASLDRRPINVEALQETVWRLFLDWPEALGFGRREAAFANLHRRLAAATDADVETIDQLLATELYGVSPSAWRAGDQPATALAARLLAAADALPTGAAAVPRLLPDFDAATAARLIEEGGPDFCRAPTVAGRPAETGALARRSAEPLVAARLAAGNLIAARLAARLLDLCALRELLASGPQPIDAESPRAGIGVALGDTARGQLAHRVQVAADRVSDYLIVAPTEWNFHPQGGWRDELIGQRVAGAGEAFRRARLLMLSLDPCVPCEITVNGHAHA